MRATLVGAVLATVAGCQSPSTSEPAGQGNFGIRFLADGEVQDFARATAPRDFVFPQDHASHPEFRTEWWYFTGNLHDDEQRHFGFEVTFFRIALAPQAAARSSAWGANQVWMAHFALTDTAARRFVAHERFAREALGLAGTTAAPLRVWVEDWSVEGVADADTMTLRLRAREADVALDLQLMGSKPPVGHGDRGLDAKGPEAGNASHYYSVPRLRADGTITSAGTPSRVSGLAWMDREWGTSALSDGIEGWDWFALHLSDGRDLMFYRLRGTDGSTSPFSGGSLIDERGARRALGADDVELAAVREWRSERSGARYPIAWRLSIPSEQIQLMIEPRLNDQEVALSVRYWEGAVTAAGTSSAAPLTAEGYLELAGY